MNQQKVTKSPRAFQENWDVLTNMLYDCKKILNEETRKKLSEIFVEKKNKNCLGNSRFYENWPKDIFTIQRKLIK